MWWYFVAETSTQSGDGKRQILAETVNTVSGQDDTGFCDAKDREKSSRQKLNTETGIRSRSKRAATGNNTRYADYYVCENTKRRKRFRCGSSSVDVQEIQDKSQSAVNAAVADSGPDLHNIDESVPVTNIDSVIESHHTT